MARKAKTPNQTSPINRKDFDGKLITPSTSQLHKNMSGLDLHNHPIPTKDASKF